MIVVDASASALVAIGDLEPDAKAFLEVLFAHESEISHINYVEAGLVLIGRGRMGNQTEFDAWLATLGVAISRTTDLAEGALRAYLAFGRGHHAARLNLADCFAYALAKHLNAPLLYKGEDFPLTDIKPALQPT